MASTNKTTHYELSQYVGSDKPTYLTDYNNDMSAIDTGIYNAQTKADSGYTLANSADGKADTALTNAGLAQTDASSALTKIGNLANLTTTEKTSVVGAINEVDADISKFNLVTFKNYDLSQSSADIVIDNASNFNVSGTITIASNSDGSIFKIYGVFGYTNTSGNSQSLKITLKNTNIYPTEAFEIFPAGFKSIIPGGAYDTDCYGAPIGVKSNGDIEYSDSMLGTQSRRGFLFPCLYFAKNFGDVPQQ